MFAMSENIVYISKQDTSWIPTTSFFNIMVCDHLFNYVPTQIKGCRDALIIISPFNITIYKSHIVKFHKFMEIAMKNKTLTTNNIFCAVNFVESFYHGYMAGQFCPCYTEFQL